MSGEPMISFSIHQARAGAAGASEDFEQMLALLVQATSGEANLVFANPGDWGIDVLVGDLRGQVTIWQAKYFPRGVAEAQKRQIDKSFASARKAAAANGYTVARWVLCIPSSMDAPTTQWWHRWKDEQERESGAVVELWDETTLRKLLLEPSAAHVRRHYYNPYRDDRAEEFEPLDVPFPAEPVTTWRGGDEYRLGGAVYLLHDEPTEWSAADRSWVWREATADRIEHGTGRFRLRQVYLHRRIPAADERHAALREQAELLAELAGRHGLPRLADRFVEPHSVTVVTTHPAGLPWAEVFGPGPTPPDRLTAAAVLAAAADLCTGLGELHRRGTTHRALDPHSIFVDRVRRAFVRDIGFAAVPPSPGEGPARYRAPEQARSPYAVDGRIDVYQLAAVVYHTLTGHPPAGETSPPVRATLPDFPEPADRTLLSALADDPRRRPSGAAALAAAWRAGRQELSLGGLR